jgi:hypothetical protein
MESIAREKEKLKEIKRKDTQNNNDILHSSSIVSTAIDFRAKQNKELENNSLLKVP